MCQIKDIRSRKLVVEYHRKLELDDEFETFVKLDSLKNSSFVLKYEIYKKCGSDIILGATRIGILVDVKHKRPVHFPDDLRSKFESFENRKLKNNGENN